MGRYGRRKNAGSSAESPAAAGIMVIGDGSPSEDTTLNHLRSAHPTSARGVPITYVANPGVAEICARVSRLGADTIVIFTALSRDDHGHPLIPADIIPRVRRFWSAGVCSLRKFCGNRSCRRIRPQFCGGWSGRWPTRASYSAGQHPADVVAKNEYLSIGGSFGAGTFQNRRFLPAAR